MGRTRTGAVQWFGGCWHARITLADGSPPSACARS